MKEFCSCFNDADEVFTYLNVYAAGEKKIKNFESFELEVGLRNYGHKKVMAIKSDNEIYNYIYNRVDEYDIIIFLGAGDITKIANDLKYNLNLLKKVKKLMEDFNNYRIETNKQLSKLTWFNVGGMSKFYFQPKTFKCLESFLKDNSLNYKIFPLGAGSNILVRDKGFDGIIIHFNELNEISLESDGVISADCGASDAEVARFARNNNRSGLEFLIGIPGTIGGGIKMNSGAYGSDFLKVF